MSERRPEEPRVTDGSRWLGRKAGQWFVYKQVGTEWESRQNPVAAYHLLCEETGEKTVVKRSILFKTIAGGHLMEIYHLRKEDILKIK